MNCNNRLRCNRFRMFPFIILTIFFVLSLIQPLIAQTGSVFNQRDNEYRLLGLKRAKEAFDFAKAEYDRKQEMFRKNLVSQQELQRAKSVYADAEVNYYQSMLAVLFEKQYVSVIKAVKRQTEDGQKHVRLTLANLSGGGAELKKMINIDEELFEKLQPDVINDVYVSLLNEENAIISQPYEAKIEKLRFGEPVSIDFTLLQDLDAVTVDIIYGSGTQRSPKIYLQKDASVNRVVVQAEQFSQEVELGASASFDLTLELFSGLTNTFKLEVVNLPQEINRYFIDPGSQARLSQFRFAERTNTRRAVLQIFLPDRPTDAVKMDQAIPFFVLAVPSSKEEEFADHKSNRWTQQELKELNIGFVRLELLPRGVGKLLVRAPQLYYMIKADQTVEVNIDVINEGTRRLNNVEVEVDEPFKWSKQIQPDIIPDLDIREEKRIQLRFSPPPDVAVGRYEFRVRTTSLSENQPINGEDKTITVEVQQETNILGTSILILLIIATVVGIVIFGIRLSRK